MLVGDGRHPLDKQFRVGSPFGIPLYFHVFLLIFMGIQLLQALSTGRWLYMVWPVVLVLSVYLHELGHALSSAYFGAKPQRIVLHLFGGVAFVPRELRPGQDLWVIAWGPLVSAILAAIGYTMMKVFPIQSFPTVFTLGWMLFQINFILTIFNVLPIFPLDGGQFLRGWLVMRKGHNEGVRRSLPLSMATLIVMAVVSLLFQWIGMFGFVIALALFLQNHYEWKRWEFLFEDGFWNYLWPFGGPSKSSGGSSSRGYTPGDFWPGEKPSKSASSSGGGVGDKMFVWWNRRKAEALMRKADEDGIFSLDPKDRKLLEKYLDAKIKIKERSQKVDRKHVN